MEIKLACHVCNGDLLRGATIDRKEGIELRLYPCVACLQNAVRRVHAAGYQAGLNSANEDHDEDEYDEDEDDETTHPADAREGGGDGTL